jgi:hypothetical protein
VPEPYGRVPAGIALNEHTDEDGAAVFRQACAMGLEGIVSKRLPAASAQEVRRKAGAAHHGVARFLGQPNRAGKIDADEIAAPLPHFAADEDALDIAGVH